jgi:hypothetical protein
MQASLRRFWIQLTADRRRFGVLCAVFGVGLLLWARLIIVSNMPRTAVAEPVDAGMAISKGPGAANKSADKSPAGTASKGGKGARQAQDVTLHHRADRDPFVISRVHFPRATSLPELKPQAGKLPTERAEDASEKEARYVARLLELLNGLQLEAAMGETMAVISGRSYRVGEPLEPVGNERVQFTLEAVRQRSVVLEYQGRRFEVQMSAPGQ